MFCRKCGKQIPNDSKFCPYCGESTIASNNEPDILKDYKTCSVCGSRLPDENNSGICDSCLEQIGYNPYEYGKCKKCGAILEKDDLSGICKQCRNVSKALSITASHGNTLADKAAIRIMKKHIIWFEECGLTVTKKIGSLLIDENKRKWAIAVLGSSKQQIHNFSDIASVEITENGEKYQSQHGIMRAVAGGTVFGAVGALVGAGTAKKTRTVSHLSVDILLNNLNCPMESIVMIRDATKTDSYVYQKAYDNVKQMSAALMVMQRLAENDAAG